MSDVSLRRIRISRIRDINDPFELLSARAEDRELRRGLRKWIDQFHQAKGLLCFSRKWDNPVLWSHYASKHRGMCLGFDVADDFLHNIKYTRDRIPIQFVDGDPAKGLDPGFVQDLLYTKFEHWAYEDEVRAYLELDHSTVEDGSYFYPFDSAFALSEVILGPLCELPIERVRELVHSMYERVPVIKARLAFKWFQVVPDERSVRAENTYWEKRGAPAPYARSK